MNNYLTDEEWDSGSPVTDSEPFSDAEWESAKPVTEKGFLTHVWEDLGNRASNIKTEVTKPISRPSELQDFGSQMAEFGGRAFRSAGQVAGFVNDAVGAGIESAYKTFVPDVAQETISGGFKSAMDTDIGRGVASGIKSTVDLYGDFKKKYPDIAGNVEAATNIAMAYPSVQGIRAISSASQKGMSEIADVAKNTGRAWLDDYGKVSAATVDADISSTIRKGIEKSIRPTVVGKRTFAQTESYYAKAEDAVKSIIENKSSLGLIDEAGDVAERLPKSLAEFSQAIDKTKKTIFTKYDEMAKQTGGTGAKVSLDPAVGELSTVAGNIQIVDLKPEVAAYAKEVANRLAKRGAYTAEETQEAIAILNESLKTFYKNPTHETATRAYVDSLVANNLRKALDESIEGAVGSGYQGLKNKYGALKEIEKDVNHRAVVDARKNTKGLIDFTDIWSGSTAVQAILSMNPALMAKAGAMEGIKRYIKYKTDPNNIIKNLFKDSERLLNKRKKYTQ